MPPLVKYEDGSYAGEVKDADALLFCLRRGDRQAQIVEAITDRDFSQFTTRPLSALSFVSLVQYQQKFAHLKSLFPTIRPKDTLGEVVSRNGLKQLRIAESEKFSHVTYFFNGRNTQAFEGEERIVEKSPRSSDFADNPGTRTWSVAQRASAAMDQGKHDFILVNLAAGDIIGHMDDWELNVRCAEEVDKALGLICEGALANGYAVVVTADHGLLEVSRHEDGTPSLEHTLSKVLFSVYGVEAKLSTDTGERECTLADVAPTVLRIMGLEKPSDMTGKSLLEVPADPHRCILVVMDGWGLGKDDPKLNPIIAAKTPWYDRMTSSGSFIALTASGLSVGLPEGRSGNSETGHLTLGCGRVIPQDELRISTAMRNGGMESNQELEQIVRRLIADGTTAHVVLMLSDKSSHGNMSEGVVIVKQLESKGIQGIRIHLVLDGRSTPVHGAPALLETLQRMLGSDSTAVVASAVGRGYMLDRSGNYNDTTKRAYDGMVLGVGDRY